MLIPPEDQEKVALLSIAAFAGTLVRLIMRPEKTWQAWLGQFIVGNLTGVFVGGYIATLFGADLWLTCFIAFTAGSSAEKVVEMAQSRFTNGSPPKAP